MQYRQTPAEPCRPYRLLRPLSGMSLCLMVCLLASPVTAQDAFLEWLPIRPFNFDVTFSQRSFAPDNRVIGVQGGITALRYGDLEIRAMYQYYSNHTQTFQTDQNSLYLNPRWNNFIDILDFPKGMPINRVIRHVLFGPLEDRAVPYLGLLGGATLPGPGNTWPGHLIGGQVGVRFPIARGVSIDTAVQYAQYGIDFQGTAGQTQQWLITTGIRF
ncbi:MAG: hypothetical protein AAB242_02195 [Nitrospirota bacterium]